jgi:hypothetical protein
MVEPASATITVGAVLKVIAAVKASHHILTGGYGFALTSHTEIGTSCPTACKI